MAKQEGDKVPYEIHFGILQRNRGPEEFFQVFGTIEEAERWIKRMKSVAKKQRNRPMPKAPKDYADIITAEYPSIGYRYTIKRVIRTIFREDEHYWPKSNK